jgi:hypothetical protein
LPVWDPAEAGLPWNAAVAQTSGEMSCTNMPMSLTVAAIKDAVIGPMPGIVASEHEQAI